MLLKGPDKSACLLELRVEMQVAVSMRWDAAPISGLAMISTVQVVARSVL